MMSIDRKKRSLIELQPGELEELVLASGEPGYRARQIQTHLFRRLAVSYEEMTDLPTRLRDHLVEIAPLHCLTLSHQVTSGDGTVKGLFSLLDGNTIESALMLYNRSGSEGRRATVCVSSQVGCAVGCPFCATGSQGFIRNLTQGEIVDQVLYFSRYLRDNDDANGRSHAAVTNIVFMGMGEPLANYDELLGAIRTLNDRDGLALGARNMTVSTSGLPQNIRKLAGEGLQVGLAVSLHAGTDEVRNRLVPLNRKYPLAEVMNACRDYFKRSGRRVSFEYVLFRGINDSPAEARALARLIQGMNCHVNLIPANETGNRDFQPPSHETVKAFLDVLHSSHITTTIRQSRGQDIDAGCGQLRSRIMDKNG